MQAERLGISTACHGAKGRVRRFTIARELRRLRAEEQRQRFSRRDAFSFGGVRARGRKISEPTAIIPSLCEQISQRDYYADALTPAPR